MYDQFCAKNKPKAKTTQRSDAVVRRNYLCEQQSDIKKVKMAVAMDNKKTKYLSSEEIGECVIV